MLCIAKVSLEVIADVTETETTLAKEEIIADKIVKTFTQNQVQLSPERAHNRKQECNTFMNLRGDYNTQET